MKKTTNILFAAILIIVLFTSCETANDSGQPIISFGEAFLAQWRLDLWYGIFSVSSFVALAGYTFYITKYKEWEVGTIVIGMALLMLFLGIFFGMPLTTHYNTTREAVSRGNYIL